jgi:NitT/TauT family transport system ATP-binding protein
MSLTLIDTTKSYVRRDRALAVLRDINLTVEQGEFLCIVGPSGCGKTTLLNIIAGLIPADRGQVLHRGAPVTGPSPERLMIFQELGLFPWLTVEENVEFGLRLRGLPRSERRAAAGTYLDMVNLFKFRKYFVHEISGGMKQRVALARALVMNPEVLLMDEPFAALDPLTRDMLHDELQRIWLTTGKTIVFVTHNVREAVCLGDRVVVFSAYPGEVKATFRVGLKRPRHAEDQELMEVVRRILCELRADNEKTDKEAFHEAEIA